jgi:hypothetical protein
METAASIEIEVRAHSDPGACAMKALTAVRDGWAVVMVGIGFPAYQQSERVARILKETQEVAGVLKRPDSQRRPSDPFHWTIGEPSRFPRDLLVERLLPSPADGFLHPIRNYAGSAFVPDRFEQPRATPGAAIP